MTTTISIVINNTQPTITTTNATAADVSTSTTPGMVVCHYTKKIDQEMSSSLFSVPLIAGISSAAVFIIIIIVGAFIYRHGRSYSK